jgi:glutaminyl-tRNA synthetase
VEEVYAEYDPQTKSGQPQSSRKVKATIHWVSAAHALPAEVRLYDRLFLAENPAEELDRMLKDAETGQPAQNPAQEKEKNIRALQKLINPDSLKVLKNCYVESELANAKPGEHFQFQRIGYFAPDPDSAPGQLIFNRTVSLKDTRNKKINI